MDQPAGVHATAIPVLLYHAITTAPGVHFDRRYEVREAVGTRFELVVWDDAGIPQSSRCEFQADGTLRARTTSPWRGDALLARA